MKQKTIKIDASEKVLGRLATEIANLLRGKNNPCFVYNQVCGNKVVVFNISNIVVTGKKNEQKKYWRHSKYIGSMKQISYDKLFAKNPCRVLYLAVKGMLPKNRLQKAWLKNLTLLQGEIDKSKEEK